MKASIYITAEGLPDAEVAFGGDEIEVRVTPPGSDIEAVIVVGIDEARAWAADIYAAVTIAYREHTADPEALTDHELAALPDPGRVIFLSLADRLHDHDDDGSLSSFFGSKD